MPTTLSERLFTKPISAYTTANGCSSRSGSGAWEAPNGRQKARQRNRNHLRKRWKLARPNQRFPTWRKTQAKVGLRRDQSRSRSKNRDYSTRSGCRRSRNDKPNARAVDRDVDRTSEPEAVHGTRIQQSS